MMEVDWLQWAVASAVLMAAVCGGAWAGYLSGRSGHGRARAFGMAMGRSSLLIFATTAILAGGLAHYELRKEAMEFRNHVELKDPTGWSGLRLEHDEWWAWEVDRHNITHWCNCPRCWPDHFRNPTTIVNHALGRATIWAFLAPVFCLAGIIPAMIACAFAYNFGVQRRIQSQWGSKQTTAVA